MKPISLRPVKKLRGTVIPPGDKSISHRAAILAALSRGRTSIHNFLFSDDCLVTLQVLTDLGVKVASRLKAREVAVDSCGSFVPSEAPLFMGESGTSARIFLGVLAGQPFASKIIGAPSLMKRPMGRVLDPLRLMGAKFKARKMSKGEGLPIHILPSKLRGIDWKQKVASAQVKSAILLAGLFAEGETIVREDVVTRDHTERMLKLFGAKIQTQKGGAGIRRCELVSPGEIFIPGDISSAAFFIVAGLLEKNAKILIKDVNINPTRAGIVNVLKRMGGSIRIKNRRDFFEPVADLEVATSSLRGVVVAREEIPSLIDELPILMVAAGLAKGVTVIDGVKELRVKETDRINSMQVNLSKMGVEVRVRAFKGDEALEIRGAEGFKGAHLKSFGDHRTAMSMFVAGLVAQNESSLDDCGCISKSFPQFLTTFRQLFAK